MDCAILQTLTRNVATVCMGSASHTHTRWISIAMRRVFSYRRRTGNVISKPRLDLDMVADVGTLIRNLKDRIHGATKHRIREQTTVLEESSEQVAMYIGSKRVSPCSALCVVKDPQLPSSECIVDKAEIGPMRSVSESASQERSMYVSYSSATLLCLASAVNLLCIEMLLNQSECWFTGMAYMNTSPRPDKIIPQDWGTSFTVSRELKQSSL